MSVTLEFHLRPTNPAASLGDHLFCVYRRFCKYFFDDAAYPCVVNVMAVGPGYMLTKDVAVRDAADALDAWEEILREQRRLFWLSVTTRTLGYK